MKLNKLSVSIILALLVILGDSRISATPGASLAVGNFSGAQEGHRLPPDWEPLVFQKIPRHTQYRLAKDSGVTVIKATSQASASGLIRKISINPQEYPVIQWRWKVSNIYQKGDVARKDGDDYPARVYIFFDSNPDELGFFEKATVEAARLLYGDYPPGGAINYIWESQSTVGIIVPNPYMHRSKMIVVQSGAGRLNQWVQQERNIFNDYRKAFGRKPPLIVGVAIMTDSDDTGESATACYGDIIFMKKIN